jgi:hypothetical protein
MVGVPAFAACWVTASWIGWPTPSLRNSLTKAGVPAKETPNANDAATITPVTGGHPSQTDLERFH